MHERENERKPSVEMDMHGGAKNRNWLFTNCVSELTYPQNALPLFGKCHFWNKQLTVGAPLNCGAAELRTSWKCGAADLMEMRTCGPADLRSCGSADLRSCGSADLQSCGAADLRTYGPADLRTCGAAELRTSVGCGPADLSGQKNSKFSKVSKLKFWYLGFARCYSKAMFGYLPLNFSIISVIFVASGRLKA